MTPTEDALGTDSSPTVGQSGFAKPALSGSIFTTTQTIGNKVITLFAMWIVARLLSPSEVGLANVAVTVGAFVFFVSPTVFGDVLLSEPRRFHDLSGAARRLAYFAGGGLFLLLVAIAYPIEWFSGTAGIAFVLLFVALRPLADAFLVLPSARMRLDLEYRRIALIDGLATFLGTCGTVLLAWGGAGPIAIVLPPIGALAIRAVLFQRICRARIDHRIVPGVTADIVHRSGLAGIGQYAHNVVGTLEPLILWAFATQVEQGYFALAFQLAVQANALVNSQFVSVLQPIFSHLSHDAERQVEAFLRVLRMAAAVIIPISLAQAALAEPLFQLLFEPEWKSSIGVFFALSIAQASVFVVTLSFTMLKAQGRFRTALFWQFGQLLFSAGLFAIFARYFDETIPHAMLAIGIPASPAAGHATAIAVASGAGWGVSSVVGMYLCGRRANLGLGSVMIQIARPWLVTLPFMAALLILGPFLGDALPGSWGPLATLFFAGPLVLLAAILANVFTDTGVRSDFLVHGRRIVSKFARRRTN